MNALRKECMCPKMRKVRSKGAMLVTAWMYLMCAAIASLSHSNSRFVHPHSIPALTVVATGGIIAILCAPFAGLIATVYLGRWRMIHISIWLIWAGMVATCFIQILIELQVPDTSQTLSYLSLVVALLVSFLGLIIFAVNAVPFGLDQMPDASSEQITAFIHWYVWSILAGAATCVLPQFNKYCMHVSDFHFVHSFVAVVLISVVLCSVFLLCRQLTVEPESLNPLRTICKVIKFASKHKLPVRRSAFTYWEPGIPSRIDLGKSKYGGPFTTEEVEDTKTCLKMLLVLAIVSITVSSFAACVATYNKVLHTVLIYHDSCSNRIIHVVAAVTLCTLFIIPVYDVVIQPLIKKCIPSMLVRAGVAQFFIVCTNIILLVTSLVWNQSVAPDQCVFTSTERLPPLPLDDHWILVPVWIANIISAFLFLTAMLEFVCAQAPYNLRGLLVGMLQSVLVLSTAFGGMILGTWTIGYQHNEPGDSMCGIWFYLFTTITAILGCVIWCVVAKWYKKRERDEPEMCRIFAENYYDH